MNTNAIYTCLTSHGIAHGSNPVDLHIFACVFTIAAQEARQEQSNWAAGLGLESWEMRALFITLFPGALDLLEGISLAPGAVTDDERALRDILHYHSPNSDTVSRLLCKLIARRCQRPNHLWQDLGFTSRSELSALMRRFYPRLVERNAHDMKWKKFLYRMICSSTGFSLCVAPVCSECDDFDECFGAEDGESLLARLAIRGERIPETSGKMLYE